MKNYQALEQHILEAANQMKEAQGITLVELSRRTGIDAARLRNVLKGDRVMRGLYRCTLSELITYTLERRISVECRIFAVYIGQWLLEQA